MHSKNRSKTKENYKNVNYRYGQPSVESSAHKQFNSNSSQRRCDASLSETDRECLLYIRDLSLDIGHHEIFEHFCIFGTLKRVNVRQRNEFCKYAIILFSSPESIDLAIRANPHKLRDKHYYCNKMGSWHLRWPKLDKQMSETNSRYPYPDQNKQNMSKTQQLQSFVYPTAATQSINNCNTFLESCRSALLPQSSKVLLRQLRKAVAPPAKLAQPRQLQSTDVYRHSLFTSMGKNFNFVRHSYTDFMAYYMRGDFYRSVPTNAKISLTADTYAAQRDQDFQLTSFYMPFQ